MNYIYGEHENVYVSMRKWQHDSTEKAQEQLLYLYLGLAFLTLLSKMYVKLKYLMLLLNLSPLFGKAIRKFYLVTGVIPSEKIAFPEGRHSLPSRFCISRTQWRLCFLPAHTHTAHIQQWMEWHPKGFTTLDVCMLGAGNQNYPLFWCLTVISKLWMWYHHRNMVWEQTWCGEWQGRLPALAVQCQRACG